MTSKILYSTSVILFFFCIGFTFDPIYERLAFLAGLTLLIPTNLSFKRLNLIQMIWLCFLGWILVCTFNSDYSQVAFQGYYLRGEGFLFFLLATISGLYYWNIFRDKKQMAYLLIAILALTLIVKYMFHVEQFKAIAFTDITLGMISCIAGVLLFSQKPWFFLIVLPCIYLSNTRSAVIALLISFMVFICLTKPLKMLYKWFLLAGSLLIALIAFSPLKHKISAIETDKMGFGARPQWILQADKLSKSLPLTGFGIDTLSYYLKPPVGELREKNTICDKVHYLPFDIILTLGWVGYGYFILLTSLALWTYHDNPSYQNATLLSIMIGWFIFGLINPQGIFGHFLAIWAFLGMKNLDEEFV